MSGRSSRLLDPRPFRGASKELIIGIDVGTTFSGVSFAILRPGEIPEVLPVERFTDQHTGDNKIPSIMYYDTKLNLKAAGATACTKDTLYDATEQRWNKVEHFKLHFRPSEIPLVTNGLKLGILPDRLSPVQAMGDFLRYLYDESVSYIKNSHEEGDRLWFELKNKVSFVLGHPNGWDGLPQQRMRQAALLGGLVKSEEEGLEKIKFVTEGEASALACLAGDVRPSDLQVGYRFMVADAGGGTLDTSSYEITTLAPLHLKEIAASDCRFSGAIFVNMKGRDLLKEKLKNTGYDNYDIMTDIIDKGFEEAKRAFKDNAKRSFIHLGDRENNSALDITKGCLKLAGSEMAGCFEFSVTEAMRAVEEQIEKQKEKQFPMPVWLVGGFGTSPWLFKQLKNELAKKRIDVCQPGRQGAKAVANGAVLFAIEHPVSSRICRNTYGVRVGRPYRRDSPEHVMRKHLTYTSHSGELRIHGGFSTLVSKNEDVEEADRIEHPYFCEVGSDDVDEASRGIALYAYSGRKGENPIWYDRNEAAFSEVCTIKCEMEHLCQPSKLRAGPNTKYWRLDYAIELAFGTTERIQARTVWKENGQTKYGPATVFYDDYDCRDQ